MPACIGTAYPFPLTLTFPALFPGKGALESGIGRVGGAIVRFERDGDGKRAKRRAEGGEREEGRVGMTSASPFSCSRFETDAGRGAASGRR